MPTKGKLLVEIFCCMQVAATRLFVTMTTSVPITKVCEAHGMLLCAQNMRTRSHLCAEEWRGKGEREKNKERKSEQSAPLLSQLHHFC